jgi:CRP-like cAMP-binding protein
MTTTTQDPTIERTLAGLELEDDVRERLRAIARQYVAPTRTLLLRKGDPTEELSILVSGQATLTEHLPGRGSMRLLTLEPGAIFGWSATLEPYRAASNVLSLTPVVVLAFDAKRLRAAMDDDCRVAAGVSKLLLRSLSDRLLATRHQLFDLYGAGWAEPIYEPW